MQVSLENNNPIIQQNSFCFANLPTEITLRIFEELEQKSLLVSSLVCKGWKDLIGDKVFWKEFAQKIGLNTEQNIDYRKAISHKITELKKIAADADPLLGVAVKTANEFDAIAMPLMKGTKLSTSQETILEQIEIELYEKLDISEKIKKGFRANLLLRRVGLSTWEKVRAFATHLQNKYGTDKPWLDIANELVFENNMTEALQILNNQLKKSNEKDQVVNNLVYKFCREGKLQEAFDFYKNNRSNGKERSHYKEESTSTILCYAKEKKQLDLVEKVIDELIEEREKTGQVINLIEIYLKENNLEKAKGLLIKYADQLKTAKKYEIHTLIQIYVQMNFITMAKNLAFENKSSDKLILYVLRNAMEDNYMKEEAAKIQDMIDKTSNSKI